LGFAVALDLKAGLTEIGQSLFSREAGQPQAGGAPELAEAILGDVEDLIAAEKGFGVEESALGWK